MNTYWLTVRQEWRMKEGITVGIMNDCKGRNERWMKEWELKEGMKLTSYVITVKEGMRSDNRRKEILTKYSSPAISYSYNY